VPPRQLRPPLLILLAVTALAPALVGQASDAVIIGTILLASVGLGFASELAFALRDSSARWRLQCMCP